MASSERPLHGKVVFVLGGSRGLGRSIALGASRLGAQVAVAARSKPDLAALEREIHRETGGAPLVIPTDARDAAAVHAAVAAAAKEWGHIDAGVYNAGVGYWEPVAEMPEERWDETLDTNLKGAFLFTRAVLPGMVARGSGQLVYVASRLAAEPLARYAAYCASKAGLRAFAEVVAREVAGQGVRVTTVLPGLIATGFSDVPHGRPQDQRPPHALMLGVDEVADQILQVLRAPDTTWIKELLVYPARL